MFVVRSSPHNLTGKKTIVLAEFANSTGDGVFDDTLRQGLLVELEQFPALTLSRMALKAPIDNWPSR